MTWTFYVFIPLFFTLLANRPFMRDLFGDAILELKKGNAKGALKELKDKFSYKIEAGLITGQIVAFLLGLLYAWFLAYYILIDISVWAFIVTTCFGAGIMHFITGLVSDESLDDDERGFSALAGLGGFLLAVIIWGVSAFIPNPVDNLNLQLSTSIKNPEISFRDIVETDGAKVTGYSGLSLMGPDFKRIADEEFFIYQLDNGDFYDQPGYLPGYVRVNIKDNMPEKTELVGNKIYYGPGFNWGQNDERLIRNKYPGYVIFGSSPEPDDTGKLFYAYTLGHYKFLRGGKIIDFVVVLDAATGETQEYSLDNLPSFIDNLKV